MTAPTWAAPNALTAVLDVAVDGATLDGAELTLPLTAPVPERIDTGSVITYQLRSGQDSS